MRFSSEHVRMHAVKSFSMTAVCGAEDDVKYLLK